MTKPQDSGPWSIFLIFLRLGLTSFGGPVAHLGFFRNEFVKKRKWLTESNFADLVALCQFLPGPASSQVGLSVGLTRGGYAGALAAWSGFTLPSAIALILFALGLASFDSDVSAGMLHGLKVVAVAVVANAVWGMARKLCTDVKRVTIMALATCFILLVATAWAPIVAILVGGFIGLFLFQPESPTDHPQLPLRVSKKAGFCWLGLFFVALVGLPIVAKVLEVQALSVIDSFYRTGSLVFGGGHVVLPLLQAEVVPVGWVTSENFLAGYGAAQAVPGPLFTFSAFLGASMESNPTGWLGGAIALVSVFLPSFFLVFGALPFWDHLSRQVKTRAALNGINSVVVGILLAALYQPVWISAISDARDFAFALLAFVSLVFWKIPVWLIVIVSGVAGAYLG